MKYLAVSFQLNEPFGSPFDGSGVGINDIVSIVLSNAVSIAGVIFTLLLVFGGIGMIAGAGNDDPQKAAQGKKAATAAVIGFVIIFATYWIVWILERTLGI